jgi:uncharacterized membrane protein
VLSVIATSMLTFTGLVFSITMLVLQAASSQLSPRVMRTFLRDRGNQVVLGLFVPTFVYTLLVLHEVRAPIETDPGFVPSLSILVAFVLLAMTAPSPYPRSQSVPPHPVMLRVTESTRASDI